MGFIKNLFKPKLPEAPKSTANIDDATVQNRANEQRDLAAKARGRQSTIVTGMLGIGSSADIAKKTLLGG